MQARGDGEIACRTSETEGKVEEVGCAARGQCVWLECSPVIAKKGMGDTYRGFIGAEIRVLFFFFFFLISFCVHINMVS